MEAHGGGAGTVTAVLMALVVAGIPATVGAAIDPILDDCGTGEDAADDSFEPTVLPVLDGCEGALETVDTGNSHNVPDKDWYLADRGPAGILELTVTALDGIPLDVCMSPFWCESMEGDTRFERTLWRDDGRFMVGIIANQSFEPGEAHLALARAGYRIETTFTPYDPAPQADCGVSGDAGARRLLDPPTSCSGALDAGDPRDGYRVQADPGARLRVAVGSANGSLELCLPAGHGYCLTHDGTTTIGTGIVPDDGELRFSIDTGTLTERVSYTLELDLEPATVDDCGTGEDLPNDPGWGPDLMPGDVCHGAADATVDVDYHTLPLHNGETATLLLEPEPGAALELCAFEPFPWRTSFGMAQMPEMSCAQPTGDERLLLHVVGWEAEWYPLGVRSDDAPAAYTLTRLDGGLTEVDRSTASVLVPTPETPGLPPAREDGQQADGSYGPSTYDGITTTWIPVPSTVPGAGVVDIVGDPLSQAAWDRGRFGDVDAWFWDGQGVRLPHDGCQFGPGPATGCAVPAGAAWIVVNQRDGPIQHEIVFHSLADA